MIPRYSRKEMAQIWEPENKFKIWLEIELLALEAMAQKGFVPQDIVKKVRSKASFNIDRIDVLEKELKHDVIAFLTCVAEYVGPEARFLHRGMTSSDVLDTCLALQLRQSSQLLISGLDRFLSILRLRAYEHKNTLMMGRSHGVHGEPITFGLKLALWYEAIKRNRARLTEAMETISVGKISGAMGNFAHLDPAIESYVCKKLELTPDPISTQVIGRDRHAHFFSILAIIGSTLDQITTEIRHLQRSEVYEVEEYFSSGQKGSSAMPHKKNPVLSENVSGLSRLLRGYAISSLENVALWHERDISHSSVERVIAPDATIVLDFMIHRISGIIEKLVVHPEQMKANINKTHGLFFSQCVLLALIDKGYNREDAYRMVQKNAMKVWDKGVDFLEELKKDSDITRYLSLKELEGLFDMKVYTQNVDVIFKRVFGD